MLEARDDLDGALAAYQASLDIRERLARADPTNAGWQRDLSVSHVSIGDVRKARGDLDGALAAYQAGLDIAERLNRADPTNAGWQRDLSVSHNKIGDLRQARGDLDGALAAYQASHDIFERLARADPTNAKWQRDLFLSYYKLGDVARKSHKPAWRAYWQRAYEILSSLMARGVFVSANDTNALAQLRARLEGPDPFTPVDTPMPDPQHDANRAQRLNLEYQEKLAAWEALPWWKRWRTPEPQPPEGI